MCSSDLVAAVDCVADAISAAIATTTPATRPSFLLRNVFSPIKKTLAERYRLSTGGMKVRTKRSPVNDPHITL